MQRKQGNSRNDQKAPERKVVLVNRSAYKDRGKKKIIQKTVRKSLVHPLGLVLGLENSDVLPVHDSGIQRAKPD